MQQSAACTGRGSMQTVSSGYVASWGSWRVSVQTLTNHSLLCFTSNLFSFQVAVKTNKAPYFFDMFDNLRGGIHTKKRLHFSILEDFKDPLLQFRRRVNITRDYYNVALCCLSSAPIIQDLTSLQALTLHLFFTRRKCQRTLRPN